MDEWHGQRLPNGGTDSPAHFPATVEPRSKTCRDGYVSDHRDQGPWSPFGRRRMTR